MDKNGQKTGTGPATYLDAVSVRGVAIAPMPEGLQDKAVLLERKPGYIIADFDGTGMMEIQKLDASGVYTTDEEAVVQAMEDGVKVIPVEELPENFSHRYLGWVDTPENRKAIEEYCAAREEPRHGFEVRTPLGIIRAVKMPDKDNPGITLSFQDKDGVERSSCLLEYRESERQMVLSVWTPEGPENDPRYELEMN